MKVRKSRRFVLLLLDFCVILLIFVDKTNYFELENHVRSKIFKLYVGHISNVNKLLTKIGTYSAP